MFNNLKEVVSCISDSLYFSYEIFIYRPVPRADMYNIYAIPIFVSGVLALLGRNVGTLKANKYKLVEGKI